MHCLLGEYETALKALGPVNPFKTANLLTPKVAGANIALYYYAGFSYLMLQRYLDATRAFNTVLTYINRSDLSLAKGCTLEYNNSNASRNKRGNACQVYVEQV